MSQSGATGKPESGNAGRVKIAHLSSQHEPIDNRIFQRECRSLAQAGYDVHFIVRAPRDEVRDGVRILAVPTPASRIERVTRTAYSVFRRGLSTDASIYHFHDPELIPWGMLLKLMGKHVIFDVHEDFSQAAGVREWIPDILRPVVSGSYGAISRFSNRMFEIIIAERYYERSFPKSTPVLNYPHLERANRLRAVDRNVARPDRIRLLYAGYVSESRGAILQSSLASTIPGSYIHFSGIIDPALVPAMIAAAGPNANVGILDKNGNLEWAQRSRLSDGESSTVMLQGVGYFVTTEMEDAFCEQWTAGLALFPLSSHYYEKELTKFFEYMAAGLPLIVSDFPNWRAIVDSSQCGFAVDYRNTDEAAARIRWLHDHHEEALRMGERGRQAMAERYSWQSQRANLLQLYQRILAEDGIAPPSSDG